MIDGLQHQYRVMFDNMPQGAFYALPDGSLVDVNSAALEMFGITRDSLIRSNAASPKWRVILEDGTALPPERYPMSIAFRTGQPVRDFVAGVYNEQQQRFVWMNISAIPMFREGETGPYQVFVILHDISQQKRINDLHLSRIHLMQFANAHPLEELLVEALDELERFTGSTIGFFHFFDEDSGLIDLKAWSSRTATEFCRVAGGTGHYSIEQAGVWVDCILKREPVIHNDSPNLPHRRGLPDGHAPVTRELVVPVIRRGRIVAVLGVGNKAVDYTEVDVHTVSLFADFTWDIAERKQSELLLLQASRRHEILTNTAMDGFWVVDRDGSILSANETGCRMHGYSFEEMLNKKVRDVSAKDESTVQELIVSIEAQGYRRFETQHYRKDRKTLDVEINAAFIPEDGLILAFVRDITERKQMQHALLRSRMELELANELLEQRVNQRTADLQAAIREQESFSYSVSHDLRAPLRHINSFSAMLHEDFGNEIPAGASEYLHRIRAASSRMGTLIDHLLEMSRVTRTEMDLEEVDLSELAVATLRMLGETDPYRSVETCVQPGLVAVGDQLLLSQLLANLLGNAWKYTSSQGSARIEFGKTPAPGGAAYFVRDNGAGFDMSYRHNLFKAFERLHGSEFDGVGIGLATAQRIVQRHGGEIWAEGEVDRGATFYFTLPLEKEGDPK